MSNGRKEVNDFIAKFENLERFIPETLEDIRINRYSTEEVSADRIINALINELKKARKERWIYLGYLNWNAAITKSESLGLSLPTRAQLQAVSWKKKGEVWYWTSEEISKNSAYDFSVDSGSATERSKDFVSHVICISLTEESK